MVMVASGGVYSNGAAQGMDLSNLTFEVSLASSVQPMRLSSGQRRRPIRKPDPRRANAAERIRMGGFWKLPSDDCLWRGAMRPLRFTAIES